ncbi:MAG: hypothetical protein ACYTGP_00325 [Planctomycetota bacterium]|jgi:predicted RNA-binding Zn-ribbon protein involved in translation (DUF1610 family)
MKLRLPFFEDDDGPSLWHDLRSGRAGALPRIGLCVAAAAACIGVAMIAFGAIDAGGHVHDHHIGIGMAMAAGAWLVAVAWIWSGYRRWRSFIQTTLGVLTVIAITIGVATVIGTTVRQAEFLIAATVLFGGAVIIVLISRALYRGATGQRIADRTGIVRVNCPECGYSMVGLESCHCPECGAQRTIDALILAQDYGATREPPRPRLPEPPAPDAIPITD